MQDYRFISKKWGDSTSSVVIVVATASQLSLIHIDISLSNVLLMQGADSLIYLLFILKEYNSKSSSPAIFLFNNDIVLLYIKVLEEVNNFILPHSEWKTCKLASTIHIAGVQEFAE